MFYDRFLKRSKNALDKAISGMGVRQMAENVSRQNALHEMLKAVKRNKDLLLNCQFDEIMDYELGPIKKWRRYDS
eukprot:CAMPEP_0176381408 /NCGR_PEP_ID=MMETSP0126-20121128/31871_1 /TAXON_ID=141414 ORGANISM="Strombidinopsis acuminatum, Strain SPMC142" /NCGR_SAMPLE_ID=MMETSP0126 /ASSEMBLY_ACC=CAM_ASM_000229 /LENGTH=74 /DNA_ID=CAMNT_0017745241 /DNA_START=667 /DNA_END=887 /DNA_ORIENTATION=-